MGIGAWITVICIVLSIWALLPRRRRAVASSRSLPVIPRQRQRRAPQPFLPLLATLLAQTAAQLAGQVSEATRVARETWQRHQRAAHMSTTMVAAPEKPIPQIALLPPVALDTADIDTDIGLDNGINAAADIAAIPDASEARQRAIRRWKQGEKLSQNDVLALLGGNRNAMLALVKSIEAAEPPAE